MPFKSDNEIWQSIEKADHDLKIADSIEIFFELLLTASDQTSEHIKDIISERRSGAILLIFNTLTGAERPEIFYDTMYKIGVKNINYSELEAAYKESLKQNSSDGDSEWKKLKSRLASPMFLKIRRKARLSIVK